MRYDENTLSEIDRYCNEIQLRTGATEIEIVRLREHVCELEDQVEQARIEGTVEAFESGKRIGKLQEQERCAEIAGNIAKRYESSANARGRTMVYEDGMGYVAVAHEIQDAIRNTEEGS